MSILQHNHALVTPPKFDDPRLKSTWFHRTWVCTGCITILVSLTYSVIRSIDSHIWIEPILAGLVGYLFADFGSGVYHWFLDNYGDVSTPFIGMQIDAFQRHHKWPLVITKHEFANHLHVIARSITWTMLPINLVCHDRPIVMGFMAMAGGFGMFSMQFHAWAHMSKSELPPIVEVLQDVGVILSRSQHASHHRQPYNNSYCIVNGFWNKFLDKYKVFVALEMVVFFLFGLRPRSWSEPNSAWPKEVEDEDSLTKLCLDERSGGQRLALKNAETCRNS